MQFQQKLLMVLQQKLLIMLNSMWAKLLMVIPPMNLSSLFRSISTVRAVRNVFPYFLQDKSIWRKRCLEAQETLIGFCRKAVGWPMNQCQWSLRYGTDSGSWNCSCHKYGFNRNWNVCHRGIFCYRLDFHHKRNSCPRFGPKCFHGKCWEHGRCLWQLWCCFGR